MKDIKGPNWNIFVEKICGMKNTWEEISYKHYQRKNQSARKTNHINNSK
jgi:hypothetical protein